MHIFKKSCFTLLMASCFSFCNLSYADTLPKLDCTLTDQISEDGDPGDAVDTFKPTTPMIYLICESEDVKKGQQLTSKWIAADTNNVAPANYQIDEKTYDVTQDVADDQVFKAKFSISKPNTGWPVGSYHVDLYVGKDLSQSVKFTVAR